ncbi:acyl-CoA dehydrogenase family protein [Nannocystis punicea]|uniref:Acyl-CoA dehydrogenase family protein n=1 Tax=Nannocystis punicea TaxID=2995304 RepID=A0ABY7HEN6_9BACT|nr:acyl-CoA dehydrogenase family protein [Nannocystis poenicansa]WAS97748.1 acyl-CoA dehydrogenase family protein [Nannocystis poenicansa]
MDLSLTEDQESLQKMVREFAAREVKPLAAELDREARFPKELVKRMAELGLLGIEVPDAYGGSELDPISYVIAMEEVSAACASTGVIMSVNNSLVCDPLLKFATDAQKHKWLTPLARGEKLGCFMLSEPNAGSDAAAQKTTAVRDGDGWVINGVKNWITNGPQADTGILFTMTDPERGNSGITAFVVDMHGEGVSRGPKDDKLGIRASHSCQVFFTDHRVSDDQILGQVGGGFKVAMATLDCGRIGIAAQALGIARAAFEAAAEYALDRKTFGRRIIDHQAVAFMLADMQVGIDAARLLTYRAASLKKRGQRHSVESSMAKLFASETANKVAKDAIQVFGGNGYVTEYPVERHFRDAKITEIYEGTSEIQRVVISAGLMRRK